MGIIFESKAIGAIGSDKVLIYDCAGEPVWRGTRDELAADLAELAELKRQIGAGELVQVVRCGECAKRCTPMCAAKHERALMDYCGAGERREPE
jgi:hypothetical protein